MAALSFRVGIRVGDVDAAARFYAGLGFEQVGSVPGPQGRPVMTILRLGQVHLIVDALVGMPFPDTERERLTQAGPRGLGVALGLAVDDLEASYEHCRAADCVITSEPADAPWGARVFECRDPFGYVWEFSQEIADPQPADALEATRTSWFGA